MEHYISPEVRDAQIERVVSDGTDSVYLHLSNGLIVACLSHMADGMPRITLHIVDPGEQIQRSTH